jgi:hypothetical protein
MTFRNKKIAKKIKNRKTFILSENGGIHGPKMVDFYRKT